MSKCVTCNVYEATENGRCVKCSGVVFTPTEVSFWRVVNYIHQECPRLFEAMDIPRLYMDVVLRERTAARPAAAGSEGV